MGKSGSRQSAKTKQHCKASSLLASCSSTFGLADTIAGRLRAKEVGPHILQPAPSLLLSRISLHLPQDATTRGQGARHCQTLGATTQCPSVLLRKRPVQ